MIFIYLYSLIKGVLLVTWQTEGLLPIFPNYASEKQTDDLRILNKGSVVSWHGLEKSVAIQIAKWPPALSSRSPFLWYLQQQHSPSNGVNFRESISEDDCCGLNAMLGKELSNMLWVIIYNTVLGLILFIVVNIMQNVLGYIWLINKKKSKKWS